MSFTAGTTGGKYTIKLTASQLPKHYHNGDGGPLMIAGGSGRNQIGNGNNAQYSTTNGGEGLNNDPIDIQTPYICTYIWRRIS